MAEITNFNKLGGRRDIYRHKYVKVRMKYGVWSDSQIQWLFFMAFLIKISKKNRSNQDILNCMDSHPLNFQTNHAIFQSLEEHIPSFIHFG